VKGKAVKNNRAKRLVTGHANKKGTKHKQEFSELEGSYSGNHATIARTTLFSVSSH
jgi:hypothetical protein